MQKAIMLASMVINDRQTSDLRPVDKNKGFRDKMMLLKEIQL
ncbi:MAG: hypothetical protein JWM14_1739 [Chitinophagaceae bacterium]|nr:hypothetical protein [Chitinophagaceae bacterium]